MELISERYWQLKVRRFIILPCTITMTVKAYLEATLQGEEATLRETLQHILDVPLPHEVHFL